VVFIIKDGHHISWVLQKIKGEKFLGPSFLHNNVFEKCISCVKPSKLKITISKVMTKLKFSYLLKQVLSLYDNSLLFFPFDLLNLMWLDL